jgi:hypothetical protein
LFAKKSKCQFGCQEVDYLGHIISQQGVKADPGKIQTMVDWPFPCNIKSLRGFLGLTRYYRKFVKGYGSIAGPLTSMLKNNAFLFGRSYKGCIFQSQRCYHSFSIALLSIPTSNWIAKLKQHYNEDLVL